MKGVSIFKWFRNVSIARKLYFTVGIMATLIAIELGALVFSINTLSSVRAYVNGEGLWSKAQKDAMYHLLQYSRSHDQADYQKFKDFMKVPDGDHKTLMELSKKDPDMNIARQGFIEGRNHKEDVDGMITLFRRFHSNPYINRAIIAWSKADPLVAQFKPIGEQLHAEINSPHPSQEKINKIVAAIDPLNSQLTPLEDEFSRALGEGSRWLENLVLRLLFIVALSVEVTGLTLAIAVSRGIQKGLNEILQSAKAVAKRDFSRKAKAFSKDEIGILANNFNSMADELERSIREIEQTLAEKKRLQIQIMEANVNLEKKVLQRTAELESKNKELEQFAYVASHDLQEPLRTTTSFVELIRKQYYGKLDTTANKYIDYIIQASDRMKTLIKDLLDYSRIGREKKFEQVDCNVILDEVLADLTRVIKENKAEIKAGILPVVNGFSTELKLLFQNLISNSIKFRKPETAPVIEITSRKENGHWLFSFSDNGIGIDKQYQQRIFIIFQRLHNRSVYEGSGIGLAHCKKIVELHGGKIWVESKVGEGSTFYFTITTTHPSF
jgi:signal transduction histidine kinase